MNERLTPMDGPRADPIIEETGKSGEDHACQFNYDVSAIADDLKKCQDERDHCCPAISRIESAV